MKRVISSSFDWNMDYKPEITLDNCDIIIDMVRAEVDKKLATRRYQSYSVDFDDVRVGGTSRLLFDVILYKNSNPISTYEFDFSAYPEYADEPDYMSHLTRYINDFISSVFSR